MKPTPRILIGFASLIAALGAVPPADAALRRIGNSVSPAVGGAAGGDYAYMPRLRW
jgi:hypothetical protein